MFEVTWTERALETLADAYVSATDVERDAMARGLERFNAWLTRDPLSLGESRDARLRIAFPAHLQVQFVVDPATGRVVVTQVTRYR